MAFTDSSWIEVQALINGVWTNITADADDDDGGGRISGTNGVSIKRGRPRNARRANAGECNFTIFNRDGKYASRNPRSPYFGLLPLNTPVRVIANPYESYLRCESATATSVAAFATDSATLDITGDIELRIDFEPDHGAGVYTYSTVGKWDTTGNQRSWYLFISGGIPLLWWSPDGTSGNARFVSATESLPDGRISLKVQLDVNNGAGGVTARFYTATSIDGTYAQLGSDVTSATTSSIFSSTADVTFTADHNGTNGDLLYANGKKFQGKIFEFRMYSNLTGTLAAKADFSDLEPTDVSYSDGTTTWLTIEPGYIASDKIRFYGSIPRWPVSSAVNGRNKYSPIVAFGKLQELSQGALNLDSAMYSFYSAIDTLAGYWPCEDGTDSTQLSAVVPGSRAATALNVTYAATDTLPGSRAVINITESSRITGRFAGKAATGVAAFTVAFFFDAAPAVDCTVFYVTTSTGLSFKFSVGTTTYYTQVYAPDGTLLDDVNTGYGTGAEPGNWIVVVIELSQDGADVDWVTNWRTLDPAIGYFQSGTAAGVTLGSLAGFTLPGLGVGHGLSTAAIGHIAGDTSIDNFLESAHNRSFRGYVGETEVARLVRLGTDNGITVRIIGDTARGTEMGAQSASNTLLGHFEECAEAGNGLLFESRFDGSLMYLMRSEMENYYTRTVSYTSGAILDANQDDDIEPVNYVTITRNAGGSSTAVTETGPRSVDNIGIKTDPRTLNLYEDDQTRDVAEWIRHLGSWDEESWLAIKFALAKPIIRDDPTLLAHMHGFDLGKVLLITNPPDYLPVREPECLVDEYEEELTRLQHVITFQTSPARVFKTASFVDGRVRVSSSASYLVSGIDDNDVSFSVDSDSPYTDWNDPGTDFYLSVSNDKERMTVTAISGTGPWTFTVTRGSPAFSHLANAVVKLWDHRVIGY